MKTVSILAIIVLIIDMQSCKAYKYINENNHLNMCSKIDTIIKERYEWKTGNYYANKILPQLIEKSNIDANCDKGTYGYVYRSDSIFLKDINNWKAFFNCN